MKLDIECQLALRDFTLEAGEQIDLKGITGLFGPSGCGKTTLLRILAGLETRASGRLVVADEVWQGKNIFLPPEKRRIAYVFQDTRLFPHLNVRGNLAFAHKRRSGPIGYDEVVERLNLRTLLERSTQALSGGEKQRVALGRALLSQPELMLLDEPMSALDGSRKEEIVPYLQSLPEQFQVPLIYVTHDRFELARLCPQLIMMDNGRTSGLQSSAGFQAWPGYKGHFQGTVISPASDEQDVLVELDDGDRLWLTGNSLKEGDDLSLTIHVDHCSIALSAPTDAGSTNILPARIVAIEHDEHGQALLRLDWRNKNLFAAVSPATLKRLKLQVGTELFCLVDKIQFVRET